MKRGINKRVFRVTAKVDYDNKYIKKYGRLMLKVVPKHVDMINRLKTTAQ